MVLSRARPLILENGDWETGHSYFKFENMWLKAEGFLDKAKEWWQSYRVNGNPDFILVQQQKNLERDITNCNKEVYGKVETKLGEFQLNSLRWNRWQKPDPFINREGQATGSKTAISAPGQSCGNLMEAKFKMFVVERRRQ